MQFKEYYNITKEKVELIDKFCVQLIGIFGLLSLNKNSPALRKYFYENRTFKVGNILSTDPEFIIVTSKLQKLGVIRIWTVKKIFSIFEALKYHTIDDVSEDEIRQILFDINEEMILPSPIYRKLINDFKNNELKIEKCVRPLYSKCLLNGSNKVFTDFAKSLRKE